ncbi:uncharacterized protein LOC141706756 [Apium graveolens]|uniref:uncharacterized protein LOC141706756 n=1 Tax=Apium graveolens TaxID=4045 RepID=UPI003D79BC75
MTRKYEDVVVAIEKSIGLNTFSLEELLGSLESHKTGIKQFDSSPSEQAFQVQNTNHGGFREKAGIGSFRDRGRGRGIVQSEYSRSYKRERGRARGGFTARARKKYESMLLVSNVQEELFDDVWYIDSGCSNHMTGNKNYFINFDECVQREVKTGNNKTFFVKECGDGPIKIMQGTNYIYMQGTNYIYSVYYVADLKHNLLSIGQLLRKGHHVNFKDDFCEITDKNGLLFYKSQDDIN